MSQHSQFRLLQERRFAPFFATMALGALNDNIYKNALAAMIVFQSAKWSGLDSSLLVPLSGLVFIFPFFLFSALFGQFADKYEKSIQIKRVKLLEVGIMLLATLGLWLQNLPLLFFVLFLLGLQSTIFGPIKYGILPQVLKPHELVGGNALVEMVTFIAILVGTISGPLLIGVEADWPIWVSLACIVVALIGWGFSLAIPKANAVEPSLKLNWNVLTETWRNISFINQNRTVLNSVLGISWFWFYGAIFLLQIFDYAQDHLGGGEQLVSALLALFIIGISTGSILCEKLSGGRVEIGLVPFGAFGLSVFGFDLYFATPDQVVDGLTVMAFFSHAEYWRISADLLLVGIFGGFYTVPLYALVQQRSDPARRSRVIAGNNILNALFMVVSSLFTMLILGVFGLSIPELFLITAVLNALVATYIFTLVPEFLMRFMTWILIHAMYRVRTHGLEHIPQEGAVVIAPNHVSFVDALIVGGLVHRPARFVMYHKIFNIPLLNLIFKTSKAIPIAGAKENPELLKQAYERVEESLNDGEIIGIFPEGGLSPDGELKPFKKGIEKILQNNPVPVVPMALCNLWGSIFSRRDPLHKRYPKRLWRRVHLLVGEPIPAHEASAERIQAEVDALQKRWLAQQGQP
ncbi:MAG: 1-acyl-sn-glycerol-3-phosphate acyltransferase [Xanthomonadales bacterium]|nr:1-acyl-sn-glycerol-3-phosphate acyltransferase [Xanthomonadales bacterium]